MQWPLEDQILIEDTERLNICASQILTQQTGQAGETLADLEVMGSHRGQGKNAVSEAAVQMRRLACDRCHTGWARERLKVISTCSSGGFVISEDIP